MKNKGRPYRKDFDIKHRQAHAREMMQDVARQQKENLSIVIKNQFPDLKFSIRFLPSGYGKGKFILTIKDESAYDEVNSFCREHLRKVIYEVIIKEAK